MLKKPKVVFTYVEAGMGHIIPMTGMASAFKEKYGDKCEIAESYIFNESSSEAVHKMAAEQVSHVKRAAGSRLYSFTEAVSYKFSSRFIHAVLDAHFGKGFKDAMKDLAALSPDLVVSTYYLPAHIAAVTNKKKMTNTLIATYSPDCYIYPAWDKRCDLFLVNNDKAYGMAVRKGFKRVEKVPFIYKESVTEPRESKSASRKALGLKDKFTVLFTSGAYGTNRTGNIIEKIISRDLPINFNIICGKDEVQYKRAERLVKNKGRNTDVTLLGFTDRLADYMHASDVAVGKGGTNTVMESVYLDCPIVINAEANRLEEITAAYCAKQGLAVREKNAEKVISFIERCMADGTVTEGFKTRFAAFKEKDGGEKCADLLFGLLKERFPNL